MSDKCDSSDIIDSMPAGVLAIDGDMRVTRFNSVVAGQLKVFLSEPLSVGAELSRIMRDEKIILMLAETIKGKASSLYSHRIEGNDPGAEVRYFDLMASPLKDASGRTGGAVLLSMDVTVRQRYVDGVKSEKNEAEFYVDLMSHDIRNFNQVTMGYIELLLLSEKLSPDEIAYLEKAQKGVTGSNKLIDNIKKVRMIRQFAGKELKRMDLGEILRHDAETVEKAYSAAKIQPGEAFKKEKRYIMADDYVHDIFRHILENAAKYDPHEQKLIDLDVSEDIDRGKAYWTIQISDHGNGIPDDKKRSVFERMTTTTKGAGLGLSIVSVIVNKYGGRIRVEDRVKGDQSKGSVFIVSLPKA